MDKWSFKRGNLLINLIYIKIKELFEKKSILELKVMLYISFLFFVKLCNAFSFLGKA